jgi:heat shock protein HslJ
MRAILLSLLLAACAAPPAAESNAPPPRTFAGTSWLMLVDGTSRGAPTLEFREAGRASGFTGCNQWFAQVDQSASGLRFEAIGMTRRACDEPALDLEREFANRLARTRAAEVDQDVLTLTGEDGAVLARFQRTS